MNILELMSNKIYIDNFEKSLRILAIIVGGFWVYLKAIRGRIFIPRVKIYVSGRIINHNNRQYLSACTKIENVGSSIAEICEGGTVLMLECFFAYSKLDKVKSAEELIKLKEIPFDAFHFDRIRNIFSLFALKRYKVRTIKVEPGTFIRAEELIEIPKDKFDAFRLVLKVGALGASYRLTRNWHFRFKKMFKLKNIAEDRVGNDERKEENGDTNDVAKKISDRVIGDRTWSSWTFVAYEDKYDGEQVERSE